MCIFCDIISGQLPSYKVYEDDKIVSFLSINPVNPGHTLVITKNHYANLSEIPEEELAELIIIVKKVAAKLIAKLNFTDYTISENNGASAGQSVPHFHFHIIPRFENDKLSDWKHKEYLPGEAEEIIKKINA